MFADADKPIVANWVLSWMIPRLQLTMLLKDSLAPPDPKAAIIVTVSPSAVSARESAAALNFASRCFGATPRGGLGPPSGIAGALQVITFFSDDGPCYQERFPEETPVLRRTYPPCFPFQSSKSNRHQKWMAREVFLCPAQASRKALNTFAAP